MPRLTDSPFLYDAKQKAPRFRRGAFRFSHRIYFLKESLSVTVRLKTGAPGLEACSSGVK